MSIQLRDKVRDKITGFEGTIVAKTVWTNGCVRLQVQSPTLHEGRPVDLVSFDEQDLDVIEAAPLVEEPPSGGPRPSITRRSEASRR